MSSEPHLERGSRARDPGASALLTDLYQLTMLAAYHEHGMNDGAVFEFFVRKLPPGRNFLLAAGLDQVLEFLENLHFEEEEIAWLAHDRRFRPEFLDWLKGLSFSGDIHALPEGTPFFPHEPILRVTAPLPEAQLVETRLVSLLQFESIIASKAARSVLAAPGKLLVDFGLRRAHGAEAGLLAARAAYLAGYDGSSTVLAGKRFGIPIFGTMAHSFVQAHASETLAFERFARAHPDNTTLLIDTYDTEAGAAKVAALAARLAREGIAVRAVRIDSGDLASHARRVRRILDDAGLPQVRIFASGGLDEKLIGELLAGGAPIDGFGVGTSLVTSEDAPALDCAYKLQEYGGQPRRKRSEGKATWPGRKQVFRSFDSAGIAVRDRVSVEGDDCEGTPLIVPVMREGRRVGPLPTLAAARDYCRGQIERLPAPLKALETAPAYPVEISARLRLLAEQADLEARARE
ncbi:MAG: nicotinate phosphoribosyltransferase [Betaproteobacteria bacterium]|nr:nicotinate phosphoribosyltransferase [Betaproteobacteria bacterium]